MILIDIRIVLVWWCMGALSMSVVPDGVVNDLGMNM